MRKRFARVIVGFAVLPALLTPAMAQQQQNARRVERRRAA
jgi:hypothetical protein